MCVFSSEIAFSFAAAYSSASFSVDDRASIGCTEIRFYTSKIELFASHFDAEKDAANVAHAGHARLTLVRLMSRRELVLA